MILCELGLHIIDKNFKFLLRIPPNSFKQFSRNISPTPQATLKETPDKLILADQNVFFIILKYTRNREVWSDLLG